MWRVGGAKPNNEYIDSYMICCPVKRDAYSCSRICWMYSNGSYRHSLDCVYEFIELLGGCVH